MRMNLGGQNEPPHKKQRTSDGTDPIASNTPSQTQTLSTVKKEDRYFSSIYSLSVISTSNGSNIYDSSTFITNSYRLYSFIYDFYW
jgi:hypothetical protein